MPHLDVQTLTLELLRTKIQRLEQHYNIEGDVSQTAALTRKHDFLTALLSRATISPIGARVEVEAAATTLHLKDGWLRSGRQADTDQQCFKILTVVLEALPPRQPIRARKPGETGFYDGQSEPPRDTLDW